jgi:hypothetical protein
MLTSIVPAQQAYQEYLQSDKWQSIRQSILSRDGHKCAKCSNTKNLHVHHIRYTSWGDELPEDLVTLCKKCHDKEHGYSDEPLWSKKVLELEKYGTKMNPPVRLSWLAAAKYLDEKGLFDHSVNEDDWREYFDQDLGCLIESHCNSYFYSFYLEGSPLYSPVHPFRDQYEMFEIADYPNQMSFHLYRETCSVYFDTWRPFDKRISYV